MATYLYINKTITDYTFGVELDPPIRSEFLISDEKTTFEVAIGFTPSNGISLMTLPFIGTINDKHYYSLPWKLFDFIDFANVDPVGETTTITEELGSRGPVDDEPTPTLSISEQSSTQVVKWSSDTVYNAIGGSKDAQKIIGTTMYAKEFSGSKKLTLNVFDVSSGIDYLRSLTLTDTTGTAIHYSVNSKYLAVFFRNTSFTSTDHTVKVYTHTNGASPTLLKTLSVQGWVESSNVPLNIHLTDNNKLIVSLADKNYKAYPYTEGSGNTYVYLCTSTDVALQQTITNPSRKIAIEASDDYLVFVHRFGDHGGGTTTSQNGDKKLIIYKHTSSGNKYEEHQNIILEEIDDGISSAKLSSDNTTLMTVTKTQPSPNSGPNPQNPQFPQNELGMYGNPTVRSTTFYSKCLDFYSLYTDNMTYVNSYAHSVCGSPSPLKSNIKFYELNSSGVFTINTEFDNVTKMSGASIDINNNYAVAGAMIGDQKFMEEHSLMPFARRNKEIGNVHVFKYEDSVWKLVDIKNSTETEAFGTAFDISVSGDLVDTGEAIPFRAFAYNISLVNDNNILVHAPLDRKPADAKTNYSNVQNTIYSIPI